MNGLRWEGNLCENWWFGLVMMCVAVCIGGCVCMIVMSLVWWMKYQMRI